MFFSILFDVIGCESTLASTNTKEIHSTKVLDVLLCSVVVPLLTVHCSQYVAGAPLCAEKNKQIDK